MDSTEIPVYGGQEQSAYNGHFESTCYHPLLLFNREGDCLGAKRSSLLIGDEGAMCAICPCACVHVRGGGRPATPLRSLWLAGIC